MVSGEARHKSSIEEETVAAEVAGRRTNTMPVTAMNAMTNSRGSILDNVK